MQTRKQASPFSNMSDDQLIFFGFDDLSSMIEHEAPSNKSVFESSDGVFGYNEPFCKHCHSRKVVKTGYNTRELYTKDGEKNIVKVQRYLKNNKSMTGILSDSETIKTESLKGS